MVPISVAVVSAAPEDVLVTFSLGSCVGVSIWDRVHRRGGLIHCMLPTAKVGHTTSGAVEVSKYVDSGVSQLLQDLYDLGSRPESLEIKVVGGASPLKNVDGLRIGDRNVAMLRKLLWKNGLLLAAERVGGTEARTMWLEIGSGRVLIRSGNHEETI
ncbi:MAG: chemotaxis protein CheD [Planctomycetaceae bacterium]|nr:chemotaxis protein CheD [Planctomycetaceae bacterium]